MKTYHTFLQKSLGVILISLFLKSIAFGQCAVNTPSNGYSIISKKSVQYDADVKIFFNRLKKLYDLDTYYFYYDDQNSHNAEANRKDGNVYLGIGLLDEALKHSNGLIGIYFVIAHELSHQLQYDEKKSLLHFGSSVRYGELQADFMAGYALAKLGYIDESNYTSLLTQVWSMGDYEWHDQSTHGTSTERIADAALGISNSSKGIESAYDESFIVAPPNPKKHDKFVARINFTNGNSLFILYGGAVYNSNQQQIGQMSGVPNTMLWRINFTKPGEYDVIISGKNVFTLNNQYIGNYVELPTY